MMAAAEMVAATAAARVLSAAEAFGGVAAVERSFGFAMAAE